MFSTINPLHLDFYSHKLSSPSSFHNFASSLSFLLKLSHPSSHLLSCWVSILLSSFNSLHSCRPRYSLLFALFSFVFAMHLRAVHFDYLTTERGQGKKECKKKKRSVEFERELKQTSPSLQLRNTYFLLCKKGVCHTHTLTHTQILISIHAHKNMCRHKYYARKTLGVCINLARLISSIWACRLMHLLRLLAAMSPVDTG